MFVISDSEILFWRASADGPPEFLQRVRHWAHRASGGLPTPALTAAYIGACNGDVLDYYEIFKAAFKALGITNTRLVPSQPQEEDLRCGQGAVRQQIF